MTGRLKAQSSIAIEYPVVKFSLKVTSPFGRQMSVVGLLVLSVGYAVFVVWQEWRFREQISRPASVAAPTMPSPDRAPLDATSVAVVFGLTTEATPQASAEPLTLQASFVVSNGLSKALLADAQGPRLYQVGDRLPGGSVLRRIEASQVLLWNKGREERLTLQPPAERFLQPVESPGHVKAPTTSARYLRPLAGPSE